MAPLVAGIIWLGVYPGAGARRMEAAPPSSSSTHGAERAAATPTAGVATRGGTLMHDSTCADPVAAHLGARARPGAHGRRDDAAPLGRVAAARATTHQRRSASRASCSRVVTVARDRSRDDRRDHGDRRPDRGRQFPLDASDLVFLLGDDRSRSRCRIDDNARAGITAAESHVLVLLATSGMMLLAAARDLMIVFLGIELMSIAVYVLAGLNRRSERSAEGALKYFLLGAFSTAFLLYGIALVYGATGTTNLDDDRGARAPCSISATSPMLLVGIALLLVGFGFKVAAVPFHMWAPDVYEGAPTPITAYMAAAVKAAAFAGVPARVARGVPGAFASWHRPSGGSPIATMVVGNAIGLAQRNLKRLLAYSSIAPRRLSSSSPIAAGTLAGRVGDAVLPARLHAGDVRRVRRRSSRWRAGEATVTIDDYAGSGACAVARRRDGGVHARAARLPDLRRRRLLRQVVRAPGGAPGAGAADDARRRPRAHHAWSPRATTCTS